MAAKCHQSPQPQLIKLFHPLAKLAKRVVMSCISLWLLIKLLSKYMLIVVCEYVGSAPGTSSIGYGPLLLLWHLGRINHLDDEKLWNWFDQTMGSLNSRCLDHLNPWTPGNGTFGAGSQCILGPIFATRPNRDGQPMNQIDPTKCLRRGWRGGFSKRRACWTSPTCPSRLTRGMLTSADDQARAEKMRLRRILLDQSLGRQIPGDWDPGAS